MIVCHCNGVSDRKIRRVVREGATSAGEVARACGAGACCGGCQSEVNSIIRAEQVGREEAVVLLDQPAVQGI